MLTTSDFFVFQSTHILSKSRSGSKLKSVKSDKTKSEKHTQALHNTPTPSRIHTGAQRKSKEGKSPKKSISKASKTSKNPTVVSHKNKSKASKSTTSQFSGKSRQSSLGDPELLNYLRNNVKNYEDVWKDFTNLAIYKDLSILLKNAASEYLDSLKQFNEVIEKLQHCNQILESKKDYLLKVKMKDNNHLQATNIHCWI